MDVTDLPAPLDRLVGLARVEHLLAFTDGPVRVMSVSELHAAALGPGRRKRAGSFELRDERAVYDWLRLRGLTLFHPSADAALRSVIERRLLDPPQVGQRYSVYAMLSGDQFVALVDHASDDGRAIVGGELELPYDRDGEAVAAAMADPAARVRAATILDTHAAIEIMRRGRRG